MDGARIIDFDVSRIKDCDGPRDKGGAMPTLFESASPLVAVSGMFICGASPSLKAGGGRPSLVAVLSIRVVLSFSFSTSRSSTVMTTSGGAKLLEAESPSQAKRTSSRPSDHPAGSEF
eukprot:CAMPEP_0172631474 /NCGR_PEP_ID=MMETSP1068-20121228/179360_1 /TAXON_ID=35684 /ORGANISM="Pseudopedinella elastica, Strain CCMP716" /LENGTH=117 /DNA_ID=CAMNT_0013442623 /DNA_START=179 /DNA_END=530 /DNA_ORIENTATION=+